MLGVCVGEWVGARSCLLRGGSALPPCASTGQNLKRWPDCAPGQPCNLTPATVRPVLRRWGPSRRERTPARCATAREATWPSQVGSFLESSAFGTWHSWGFGVVDVDVDLGVIILHKLLNLPPNVHPCLWHHSLIRIHQPPCRRQPGAGPHPAPVLPTHFWAPGGRAPGRAGGQVGPGGAEVQVMQVCSRLQVGCCLLMSTGGWSLMVAVVHACEQASQSSRRLPTKHSVVSALVVPC